MSERWKSIPEGQGKPTISAREANDLTREYVDTAQKVFGMLDARSTPDGTARPTRRVLASGMHRFLRERLTITSPKGRPWKR